MTKKFAQQLTKYIDDSGVKQTKIASLAGISYNYLQRLLAGSRHPSEQVVHKLAEALHLGTEQTGELLTLAGYVPSLALLQGSSEGKEQFASYTTTDVTMRLTQQFYKLAQEIPEERQSAFLEEMKHLLGYARYKYVLGGGANLLDLHSEFHPSATPSEEFFKQERSQLQLIGEMIEEFHTEVNEVDKQQENQQKFPLLVEDIFSAIDRLIGGILAGEISIGNYQPQMFFKIFDTLREGAPWEIRRRLAEALPALYKLDASGTEKLLDVLRIDYDEEYKVDVRRRVVEAMPELYNTSALALPAVIKHLQPISGDDIYVALATVEACGDIYTRMKQFLSAGTSENNGKQSLESNQAVLEAQKYKAEIPKIQRQLLSIWEGKERESIQFSMALYDLLCAYDTMVHSLRDGLQSSDKLLQQVAARYLERVLPYRPAEALELYKSLLQQATVRNVRRSVAKALPRLISCLEEASLSIRTLARTVISSLATDSDIFIRRAVADHIMQIFRIDREFVFILLRHLHKDKDQAIRSRLQPVVFHLAEIWLTSYAETIGLIDIRQKTPSF